jgi:serine/threonine protein kinase/WD40 repeat protein/Tfp pilus assembly protein PilF
MNNSLSKFEPVEHLAEEFLARYRRGERPSLSEYTRKYPELAELIGEYFPAMILIEQFGSIASEAGEPNKSQGKHKKIPEQLGEYHILRELGRGGMGIVYEAVQETLGRHVALKVLPFHGFLNRTPLERFRREARAAARLHHTNIVPVFGVGEYNGIHYYAMQFIHGQGLDEVIREVRRLRAGREISGTPERGGKTGVPAAVAESLVAGRFSTSGSSNAPATASVLAASDGRNQEVSTSLSTSQSGLSNQSQGQYFRSVAQIGVQVAEALEYAHREGILHRDIKPSNLLLDTSGRAWVTDFGLAKVEDWEELTNTGDVVGTMRYMAPERFQAQADPRSDVYGLGITLYEMLTLRPAFEDSNRARLMERIAHHEPPRPRKLDRRIPRDLETVVLKATAKEPGRRYATAAALAEDLRSFLADRPVRARPAPLRERGWRWCRRNPAWATLIFSVVLLGLVIVLISFQAALWLREEAFRAKQAEHEAKLKLWQSKRDHARAARLSRQVGQRIRSLQVVAEAADLARELNLPEKRFLELRNEAIACLALPDLRVAREWDGWPAGANAVDFDGKLQRYARVDREGVISVRRVADDAELCRLSGLRGMGSVLLSSNGEFLMQESGHQLRLWKLTGPEPTLLLQAQNCTAWRFSPDSRQFGVGSADGRVSLYALPSGQQTGSLEVSAPPGSLAFHPRHRQLAIAFHTGVQIRDLDTNKLLAEFSQERDPWPFVAWHPNGKMLASFCAETITLWDIPTQKQLAKLEGLGHGVSFAFNHRGNVLAGVGWDRILRLWDPHTAKLLFQTRADAVTPRFSPDDRLLAGEMLGHKLRIWEVFTSGGYQTLARDPNSGRAAHYTSSISPDGRLLAVGMYDGFGFWDLWSRKELPLVKVKGSTHVLFERAALLANAKAGLLRWPVRADASSGGWLRVGPPERLAVPGSPLQLAQSADGRVTACPQPWGAYVVLAERPQQPIKLWPHDDVRYIAVSPDGRWVATGSHGPSEVVKVWEAATGKHVADLATGGGAYVAFSPDDKYLATGGDALRVWEAGSWHERLRFATRHLMGLAFSPNSQLLAYETGYGVIRLVDPDTGREFAQLEDPDGSCAGFMTFSPDGSQLVVSPHIWDLRCLRLQLADMGLDWHLPPFEPGHNHSATADLRVEIDLGSTFGVLAGDDRTAIGLNSILLALNPFNGEAYLQVGRIYGPQGQHAKAIENYNLALAVLPQQHPSRGEALFRRSNNYASLKENARAAADLQQLAEQDLVLPVELRPLAAQQCNELAWRYARDPHGEHEPLKALPLVKKALALEPDARTFLNTLGVVYYRLGRYREAVDPLESSLAACKDATAAYDLFPLAMCYARLGDAAKAGECYQRALKSVQEQEAKLQANEKEELRAFRAEADSLLKTR